ncbi:hypothetical protein [Zoogloea sp.]|uniref:hypothetical protein n=1 Tax=Zoogloea sp. TaxID=49181 RepID=UPI0026340FAD|nr:hypothetical protein [Zoogloea sp.]
MLRALADRAEHERDAGNKPEETGGYLWATSKKKGAHRAPPTPTERLQLLAPRARKTAFLLLVFASSTWREVCRSVQGADLILIKTLSSEGEMI